MNTSDFRFDEETHKYYLGDKELPGVTTVLREWYKVGNVYFSIYTGITIPVEVFEAAQDRGNAVHNMLELCLTGQGVDKTALHPDLLPYLKSIENFINDYQPEPELIEKPLHDAKLLYAGKLDFYGKVKGVRLKVLLDAKSGMAGQIGPQTSAYENLVRINTKYRGLIDRYLLSIKPEGYTFHKIGTARDFTYFLLKLKTYQYERGF